MDVRWTLDGRLLVVLDWLRNDFFEDVLFFIGPKGTLENDFENTVGLINQYL